MPEISRFLGIIIFMLYDDHVPPHFHAKYGKYLVSVNIDDGAIVGEIPRKEGNAVRRWYALHREELLEDWELAREHAVLKKIAPLE